jgi:predicted ATPase/signal transduction histidine kinase
MADNSEYELQPLRQGADFTLYRGRQRGNQMPILAVAVSAEQPSPQSLRRLEHEYSLAGELDAAWAAQPLALTRHQGRAVLILRDPGGEPLDRVIKQHEGQPIDFTLCLPIAIGLAAALGQAHRKGIIHKDVKPENALVHDSGRVWLTGFGIASRFHRERLTPAPPEIIAGTLAYMSPEQTGRMNRSMDARSDLYSLGVILYQMLTGVLPFAAADPLEWVHCHIARQPVAPAERGPVPEPLSAIIMKLLAKNTEERYRTAAGLDADLRRCLSQWQPRGRIDPFPLGTDDSSDHLLIPEKLYGRELEVAALLDAFDRVMVEGVAELVLVSGYSGVGKSSVVNELHKVLVPPRGLFASGKFDQYKRDVPYATLAQAFQMLVRQILVKTEVELDIWRRAFLEALGANGQLIVNLIPELEFIIGKQPPVAELPPQEARGRFHLVFRRFLGAFATADHPLALFLDDLQWLDTATLGLLQHLITDPDVRHVLLIGAYRDNEVSASHPLMRTLAAIREAGGRTTEVVLAPLRLDDIERLVADSLRCPWNFAAPLALLIHEKTGGNSFFAIQLLTSLAEEGLLQFDRDALAWIWNLDRIRTKGYSGNVVDLMVVKLRRLHRRTQTRLQQLACLGNTAELGTLSVVFGQSEDEIHASLSEAVRSGLILRTEGSYAFLHDRIQEAAYALIPENQRPDAHLRIGRLLLNHVSTDGRDGILFEIVSHFKRCSHLLDSLEERVRIAQLNLLAGGRAKHAAAYSSALTYFVDGAALLAEDRWIRQYPLAFELELHRAECEFLTGELAGAHERLSKLAGLAANLVDQAMVTCLRLDLYIILVQPERAVAVGLEYLLQVGLKLSLRPTDGEVRQEYERIWQRLGSRRIEDLIDLPLMNDAGRSATIDVLNKLMVPALYSDQKLHQLLLAHMVNFSMEHGNSAAACVGYAWLGRVLASGFGNYAAALRFGQLSLDLVDKRGLDAFRARVYFIFGTGISCWAQHFRHGLAFLSRASDEAGKVGDLPYIGVCYNDIVLNLLASGEPLAKVDQTATEGLDHARKIGSRIAVAYILGQLHLIRLLRGLPCDFTSLDDQAFDAKRFERRLDADSNLTLAAALYWCRRMQAFVFEEDYAAALEAAPRSQALLSMTGTDLERAEHHFYAALARAGSLETVDSAPTEKQIAHLEVLRAHHRQLQVWAENCPENFENRAALVGAEIARIEGRVLDSMRLYEQAIRSAHASGLVHNEALANEIAGRFYLARGIDSAGCTYLRNARNCYDRWGAQGKVKQLDERHPRLRAEPPSAYSAMSPPVVQLDVETVVKASQALSSEMVLPRLLERLMRIAVEHAGAERGSLILIRHGEPRIEAQATPGQGKIEVAARDAAITPSDVPQSVLNYAIRTQKRVLLDDASSDHLYSKDEYVRRKRSRSVLCLPIVKRAKLVGALYLENGLTPGAFTPDRVTVLELLASQAAISLENAVLYTDLQRSEAFLAQGQRISHNGSFGWSLASGEFLWSEELYNILEYDRGGQASAELAVLRIHPDDRDRVGSLLEAAKREGSDFESVHRLLMPDGRIKHVHTTGRAVNTGNLDFVGAVRDITERTRAEEALRQAQADLARINRVTVMGELAASLAHELSQPISGATTNASTCLRKLGRDAPNLHEVRVAVTRFARDAQRAADIVGRIRSLFARGATNREIVDINEINRETVALLRDEAARYNISVRTELAADLPQIVGDRVQLQQVSMNLIVNGIEAMKDIDGSRELVIKSQRAENEQILVSVSDTGIGFPPQLTEQIFDPFFTTKPHGTGMGLRISRSIIESHSGRLWAAGTPGRGATFHLILPAARELPQPPPNPPC